ncbi:unnamed protein product, partial [Dovyalis caffra]
MFVVDNVHHSGSVNSRGVRSKCVAPPPLLDNVKVESSSSDEELAFDEDNRVDSNLDENLISHRTHSNFQLPVHKVSKDNNPSRSCPAPPPRDGGSIPTRNPSLRSDIPGPLLPDSVAISPTDRRASQQHDEL